MQFFKVSIIIGTLLAGTMTAASAAPSETIHLEAENGQLVGTIVAASRPGYTGTGYVTGFETPADKLTLTISDATAGVYDARIRYSAPQNKGYELVVNGAHYSGMFPPSGTQFATQDAGNVPLKSGENTVEIQYGWGHYDIDSISFVPATIAPLVKPSDKPVDPEATPVTRALLAYLVQQYGKTTLSGQYGDTDNAYVLAQTGKTPAIHGGDFMDYSPSRIAFGAHPDGLTEKMITDAKAGQIITMVWHWNAPTDLVNKMQTDAKGKQINNLWYRGFYTSATTFDLKTALADPNSQDYKLLLSNMDAIAAQLKKFSDADVPVLWRPLHEAEGGWFWWGAQGPEPFKQLWKLMYDRFTNVDHLHNLIWVYSSGTNPAWYPGDKYVDIVGIDEYPSDVSDPEDSAWKTLQSEYGGRKLVAMTEFGGAPDVPKMHMLGARYSYFVTWNGNDGPNKMDPSALKEIYNSPLVVTSDNLPSSVK